MELEMKACVGSTIMFYINSIHDGGAERVILALAAYYSRIGYRSILVTSFIDHHREYPIPPGVERVSIEQEEQRGSFLSRNIYRVYALRQLCKQYKPTVVISFMGEPNIRAMIATMGLSIKNIISIRSDPSHEYAGLMRSLIAKGLFLFADGAVFQSLEAMQWFPDILQRKSLIIGNPIENVFFEASNEETAKNIVAVGRLERVKNFHLLIEAFARIEKKYPEENLLIYGEGSLRTSLQLYIERLGLDSRIKLMGYTDDVLGALVKAKMFVMSSDWEGMPNALLEAMAVGLPVIATDCPCGAPRTIIQDGKNGVLIPVRDVGKLAVAMEQILSNPVYSRELGNQAKQDVRQTMRAELIFSQWEGYIAHVLNKGMSKKSMRRISE